MDKPMDKPCLITPQMRNEEIWNAIRNRLLLDLQRRSEGGREMFYMLR